MNDWHVVDRSADPTPGDPAIIRELARSLMRDAATIQRITCQLDRIASTADGAELKLEGQAAPWLKGILRERPGELRMLGNAYSGCANALYTWANDVTTYKQQANSARSDAQNAYNDYCRALRNLQPLLRKPSQDDIDLMLRHRVKDPQRASNHTSGLITEEYNKAKPFVQSAFAAERSRGEARKRAKSAYEAFNTAARKCALAMQKALYHTGIIHTNPDPSIAERAGELITLLGTVGSGGARAPRGGAAGRRPGAPGGRANEPNPPWRGDGKTPGRELSNRDRQQLERERDDLAANYKRDYENFQKDPDHRRRDGSYPMDDGARREAKTALDARERSILPDDIQRPSDRGKGDLYSPKENKYYDIKEVDPSPNFNIANFEKKLEIQIQNLGRVPVIDTRNVPQGHIDAIRAAVKRRGWEGNVIWYP